MKSAAPIRVVHRMRIDSPTLAFARSWLQTTAAMCAEAPGFLGGRLLREVDDPRRLVIVTRWKSAEAWRDFWAKGPPEPQGDPAANELLVTLAELEPGSAPVLRREAEGERGTP
jgi:quinol monooxygenase YgiN